MFVWKGLHFDSLKEIFAGCRIWSWRFCFCSKCTMWFHGLWACIVSEAVCCRVFIPLAAAESFLSFLFWVVLKTFVFISSFRLFHYDEPGEVSFVFILLGICWPSWHFGLVFIKFGRFLAISSNTFSLSSHPSHSVNFKSIYCKLFSVILWVVYSLLYLLIKFFFPVCVSLCFFLDKLLLLYFQITDLFFGSVYFINPIQQISFCFRYFVLFFIFLLLIVFMYSFKYWLSI